MKKGCSVKGCPDAHEARGFCNKHYIRWKKYGDPLVYRHGRERGAKLSEVVQYELSRSVLLNNGCLKTQSALDEKGYGHVTFCGKRRRLTRLVLENKIGRHLAKGEQANHTCHNPSCINPEHLYVGTHQRNMADMVASKRQVKGARSHWAKLTESAVRRIRRLYSEGLSYQQLAEKFHTSRTNIGMIVRRSSWKHVS